MNSKLRGAAIIGQSGGPTVVINQSLIGFIEEARKSEDITRVLGARHGVEGMMQGDWIDLGNQSSDLLEAVARTPAAALGSVRRKASVEDVALMIEQFKQNDIRYFFYIPHCIFFMLGDFFNKANFVHKIWFINI